MARVSAGNEGVMECTQMDCHNHMRNVFFANPIKKALSADLLNLLKDSLSEIDRSLRVGTVHTSFSISYNKEFSQCCNYPKGGGMFFTTYLRKKFPHRLHILSGTQIRSRRRQTLSHLRLNLHPPQHKKLYPRGLLQSKPLSYLV